MAQEFYKEALFARIYLSSHRVRLIFYDFIYIYIYEFRRNYSIHCKFSIHCVDIDENEVNDRFENLAR